MTSCKAVPEEQRGKKPHENRKQVGIRHMMLKMGPENLYNQGKRINLYGTGEHRTGQTSMLIARLEPQLRTIQLH
jgi:hypothetical protein